ncbi:MAG TPA: hypothetical protein PLA92_05670 [Fimbriimonadaceae bacterium]|nr:MAG: hypothetical protein BroJett009_08780 [Armatimonadota bacterium]HQU18517.1 hypothetical protein [Fimbriimonadaceae bacterium]
MKAGIPKEELISRSWLDFNKPRGYRGGIYFVPTGYPHYQLCLASVKPGHGLLDSVLHGGIV